MYVLTYGTYLDPFKMKNWHWICLQKSKIIILKIVLWWFRVFVKFSSVSYGKAIWHSHMAQPYGNATWLYLMAMQCGYAFFHFLLLLLLLQSSVSLEAVRARFRHGVGTQRIGAEPYARVKRRGEKESREGGGRLSSMKMRISLGWSGSPRWPWWLMWTKYKDAQPQIVM